MGLYTFAVKMKISANYTKTMDEFSRGWDGTTLFKGVARQLDQTFERNFKAEGRPKWKPPKRPLEGGTSSLGRSLLTKSGALRKSVKYGAMDNKTTVNKNGIQVKSNLPYAEIHQFGGKIPKMMIKPKNKKALAWTVGGTTYFSKGHMAGGGKIDARPFAAVPDDDMADIKKYMANQIIMQFKRGGGMKEYK